MRIDESLFCDFMTMLIGHKQRDDLDPELNTFITDYFDFIKSQSVCLNQEQVGWLATKLHTLTPSLYEENRVLFKELIKKIHPSPPSTDYSAELTRTLGMIDDTIFEEEVERWVKDDTVRGDKEEAANRMKTAYVNKSDELSLYRLNLSSVPGVIGKLTHLKKLNLSANGLEIIPPEIGNLQELTDLNLCFNDLKEIPSEIGNLVQLEILELFFNRLQKIPPEIGRLLQLKKLWLHQNRLQTLPHEIGNLRQLTTLTIASNRLEYLPLEIGNLIQLEGFNPNNNEKLAELPLTLGNIPGIIHFLNTSTKIPYDMVQAILQACAAKRKEHVEFSLSERLKLWMRASGREPRKGTTLKYILNHLKTEEKNMIYEWLVRLERARDFQRAQKPLATIVCEMLASLEGNKPFEEAFFNQLRPNLEACEDRTVMVLNVIYTSWRLHTIKGKMNLQAKLQLLSGLAKTLTLRKVLSRLISKRTRELSLITGRTAVEKESVEIYLFYEFELQYELELITAIKSMSYAEIGNREWIKKDKLVRRVNEKYLEEMTKLPQLECLLKEADDYQEPTLNENSKETQKAYKKLSRAKSKRKKDKIMQDLQRRKEQSQIAARKAWIEKHI